MIRDLRIAVIGAGVMGEAIIGGLLKQDLVAPDQLVATELRAERRVEIEQRYGVRTTDDNVEAAHWAQVAIFAVKPQTLPKALPELCGALGAGELVISIVAGAPIHHFVEALGHPAIVRSMPNTPAQIGEGMTVWTAAEAVTEAQRGWARTILGSLGRELFVDDETYLDMATALNGTGPAYFFLLLEAMIDAGVHLGLPRYMSEELVVQTALGSVRYAMASGKHMAELRNGVTSPGGTTAAALYELERGGLRTVLSDAIWSAYRRSAELGKSK
ncbi:MAG: pyrroline-5-carboxylate reductase [Roseiflexaceae bacterium]